MRLMQTRPVVKLGISPCPNDTFAFYHLLDRRHDLPFEIELTIADVEELNTRVMAGGLDISKVSFHLFGHMGHMYCLLRSGSAMGRGCGPLLLSSPGHTADEIARGVTALPGRYTTASMLFRMFMAWKGESRVETVNMNFAAIPDAVASGRTDAGVVIHESRFTYREMGLDCIQDLGLWWEDRTGMPIPLGGIVAKRSLDPDITSSFDQALRESIEYASEHPDEALAFSAEYAQEMAPEIMKQHVKLYVNEFTVDIGEEGEKALRFMFEYGIRHGIFRKEAAPVEKFLCGSGSVQPPTWR